ncbi:helix-turn-helix domain-containing protein [Allohahella sp. A8]|uniref:helix-turn-helix domain-containing protein n=1 Tax=Allohahella sp. A8 TaxID=3141461 RepID=UPI003A7FEFF4
MSNSEKPDNAAKMRNSGEKEPAKDRQGGAFSWVNRLGGLTSGAFKLARKTGSGSYKVGKSILNSQDQLRLMAAAGQSLKDLREVTGLTITEISDAVNLKDRSFWEAVEDGTATLSFELILRLSALLARNDPIPFILKYTRTYNPEIWRLLNDWGLGRLPLQYERERQFINIYRRHDAARTLSDEGFQTVLGFTRKSFEMSLHFIQESERLTGENERLRNENAALQRSLAKAEDSARRFKTETARQHDEAASEYRRSIGSERDKNGGSASKTSKNRSTNQQAEEDSRTASNNGQSTQEN